jgi:hypothetical protein
MPAGEKIPRRAVEHAAEVSVRLHEVPERRRQKGRQLGGGALRATAACAKRDATPPARP